MSIEPLDRIEAVQRVDSLAAQHHPTVSHLQVVDVPDQRRLPGALQEGS
jgi:hypothetical protein